MSVDSHRPGDGYPVGKLDQQRSDPLRPHLRFYKDVVVKSGPISSVELEVEKTKRAFEISREVGLFRVPRVLDFNDEKGEIVLERISGLKQRHTQTLLAFAPSHRGRIVDQVGKCLAAIHDRLELPDKFTIDLDTAINWHGEHVYIHGDFDIQNVNCLVHDPREIVILDWQMTRLHGGKASFGTHYFDLAWFMMNLFFIRKRGFRYAFSLPTAGLAKRFARSYLSARGREANDFRDYLRQFFAATVPVMFPKTTILRQRIYTALLLRFQNRFIERCSNF